MYIVKNSFAFIRTFSSLKMVNWIFFKPLQDKLSSELRITEKFHLEMKKILDCYKGLKNEITSTITITNS